MSMLRRKSAEPVVVPQEVADAEESLQQACKSGMRGHSTTLGQGAVLFNNGHREVVSEREGALITAAYLQGREHEAQNHARNAT